MRIILSPAKQMREDTETLAPQGKPAFLTEAWQLLRYLQNLSYEEAKRLWAVNDRLAARNYALLGSMDLDRGLTPAILSYDGIAYQYMAPGVFSNDQFAYVQAHLRILSGFYGVLRPLDGVTPYRLEMQARIQMGPFHSLYQFWSDRLYHQVLDSSRVILNLASQEYARSIRPYLTPEDTWIDCVFGEESNGRILQKGVYAKMARGEMVRFLAERNSETPEDMKQFDHLGYRFAEGLSTPSQYVFLRPSGGQ